MYWNNPMYLTVKGGTPRWEGSGQGLCPPGSSQAGLAWGVQAGGVGVPPFTPARTPSGASHAFGIDVLPSAAHRKGGKRLHVYVLWGFEK